MMKMALSPRGLRIPGKICKNRDNINWFQEWFNKIPLFW